VAATIALVIEAVLVVVLVVSVLGTTNIGDDAQELLKAAEQAMSSAGPGAQVDPNMVADILLQPAVLIAAFGLFGLAGPLAEELAKASGVAGRRPPTRYRAWFWGAAAGAGFGMTEAIALGGVLTTGWGAGMLVRAIAMVMHATMSGLAGLGWHAASIERRRGFGLFLLACAVGGHMAWNSLVLGSVVAGIASAAANMPALMGVASGAIFSLILLFFAIFLGFRVLARRLGEEEARARSVASGSEPDVPSAAATPPGDQAEG
jgi:preprotein translocase subunit SecG